MKKLVESNNIHINLLFRGYIRKNLAKAININKRNGIIEERYINIGGIEQWVSIRGEDISNPILLILHGGPGSTYSIFTNKILQWEKHFTIVQWDQRCSGKTYSRNRNFLDKKLTYEMKINDGIELIEYLCKHLNKEKIILLGSSVGSFQGVAIASKRPDLLYAYVGTSQNAGPESMLESYEMASRWFKESSNKKGLSSLEKLWCNFENWTQRDLDKFHQLVLKANRNIANFAMDILVPSLFVSPNHKIKDIFDYFKGMNYTNNLMFQELRESYVTEYGFNFNVPFFIFQGDSDGITPVSAAKSYFDKIEAPIKKFQLINNSGHLAEFTRPEEFLGLLLKFVRPIIKN